jgi:predicted GH43/DUF377 family glycosyl hydrolase
MEPTCCDGKAGPCTCGTATADIIDAAFPQPQPFGESEYALTRLGSIMTPQENNIDEIEGVLNPALTRGNDGELYLFARVVGKGNFSRIGRGRVLFSQTGDPYGVERLGYALLPEMEYEQRGEGGGCEDPRITFFAPLDLYIMTYTAFGPTGPRIAIAVSKDLVEWDRRGLVWLEHSTLAYCTSFETYNNKDGVIFPEAILGPDGKPSLALIHRPSYDDFAGNGSCFIPCGINDSRASIWISYCPLEDLDADLMSGLKVKDHRVLATPTYDWESLRIGAGASPIRIGRNWLLVYHGVSETAELGNGVEPLRRQYQAGVLVLDGVNPLHVLYRSVNPILSPSVDDERCGVVPNVVFPSGLDVRNDLGLPQRIDIYYGMADSQIGVAKCVLEHYEKY